jgi:hypothetical protein
MTAAVMVPGFETWLSRSLLAVVIEVSGRLSRKRSACEIDWLSDSSYQTESGST